MGDWTETIAGLCGVPVAWMEGDMKSDLIDIAGEIQGETDKAYRFYDGIRTVWLPKSQCEWDQDDLTMAMPSWLAQEKELI